MTKPSSIFTILIVALTLAGCSKVLQNVELKVNVEDNSTQEEFNVVEKTLTFKEAGQQNKLPFKRTIQQTGRGQEARSISEDTAMQSNFPTVNKMNSYKIGLGDVLSFSRLIENNNPLFETQNEWPDEIETYDYKLGIGDTIGLTILREKKNPQNQSLTAGESGQNLVFNNSNDEPTISTNGRIGSDGSVLLLEVGRLEADGKTLNELRSEVRNNLIRNGISPRFQLEIVEFQSKKVYLTINELSKISILNDQKTNLRDILTNANVGLQAGIVSRVSLHRNGKKYSMSLRGIYSEAAPKITIISGDHIFVEDSSSNVREEESTVDHDGYVVFAGIGKLKASDRTLDELEQEISTRLRELPDSENAFQIKIVEAISQTAIVNIQGQPGEIVPISDKPVTLDEVLTENNLSIDGNSITRITLHRDNIIYTFTLDALLNQSHDKIYLQTNDRIFTETFQYKDNKVFVLGAVAPKIFKINPAKRETLADVLFASGGVLNSPNAKRSEVYLLRGKNPISAYHLDAQNPARLLVADAMELRPNDILFVAEQPIISFNRALGTILPLRILLRDIQDENIP